MSTTPKNDYDIRLAAPDDPVLDLLGNYAFADTPRKPADEDEQRRRQGYRRDDKTYLSYVDGEALAKVAILPMTMNVRGVVMPMGGISGVACMPVGRRGGHIRALMNHSLEVMRADGQPVSSLYPFRESFYERFGFTGWTAARWIRVNPANLGSLLKTPKQGTVRQRSMKDGAEDWIAFLKERQEDIHGFSLNGPARQAAWAGENQYWVTTVHEDDAITGAMIYRITDDVSSMVVMSFLWSTVNAQYQLLEFVARHVDQIREARICVPPGSEPELWLTDAKMTVHSDVPESWFAPMARVVSIDGLQGIHVGTGEITVSITDPQCPWNEGIWTLRSADGQMEVEQGGEPQAELTIQALSALIFSGIEPSLLRYRGWGDPDDASITSLRALFPPVEPFIFEMF